MCRQNYTSKQGFVEHRRLQHSASSADSQLPAILEMCARPADKGHVGKCSLCFTDGQSLLTHVAHHMLSLALFTLPLQDDKELGDGGSNKVQGEASKGLSVVDQRQTASSDSDVMSEISEDIEQEGTDDTGLSGEELNFTASIESAQISNLAIEQGIVKGQDDDFWDRAFQISRRQDSWLPYEELLTQQMKGRAPPAVMAVMNGSQRDQIMSKLVVEKANMIEKAAWENQTAALVRVVAALLLVRERLSSGATTDPHSALAWAGVCLLLPLALDGYIDSTGFVDIFDDAGIDEGLECMSGLIISLSVIQHIYQQNADVALSLSNDDKKRKETFESQMTKVCSQILNFQAQAVHQILQKKVAADQSLLPKLTLDLKELDAACQESYSVVDTVKVKATLAQQEFRMKELVRLQGRQWPEQKKAPRGSRESGPVSAPTRDEQWSLSACLQVLRNGAYESGKDRYPDRASGTCQWVLKHSAYSGWLENGSSKILWINAAAGYGKSVLLRSLVDGELRSTTLATSCYFFFSEDSIDRRSATGALSTLLYQLCSRNRDLLVKANEAFRLNGYQITRSLPWLWNLLTSLAQCPEAGRVICVLDALDECEETGRKGLIAGLNELHSKPNEHDSQLRFLVTSRPIVSIERQFDSNILRLSGDSERGAIKQEIERVISDRVPCIAVEKALDTELQSVIEARLLRTPNPTQLWLHLVIAAILQAADVNNPRQVARFIECLPENTNAAYKALVKLSPQPEQASKLLHVVASAVRPLTLREINITLNIQDGHKAREEIQRQPEQGFSEYINDLCDPYIGVYQGKVYAGHPTVKEWWAPADRLNASSKYWAHPPITTRSDRILAELCLMYLSLDVFKDDPLGTDTTESGIHDGSEDWYENRRVQVLENARTHDFLEYASIYWIRHLRRSEYDPLLLERWNSICEPQSNRFRMWFRIFWYGNGMKNNLEWTYKIPQFTPLAFAAYLGDIAMARRLIEKGENLETRVGHGWPPLLTAINQGDEAMTIFLIEQGASFSSEGVEEWTPLGLAATRGFQKIADYLIDRGANVEQKTRIRGITALQRASATGHIAIATTLLRNGAGIDTQDSKGATALLDIASTGRILVAEMLIDNGADIGACDYRGSTALHYATRNCQDNLAQMLLEHGIEVDVRDEQERTPLSWAAEHGLHGTTKALIAGGADVDAVDEEGLTPLLYAIKYCHGIIAQELLTMGADVNTSNEEEQTALVCAVRQNDQKMVQTLLKSGPDPNIADQDGQTPLMHATGFQKGFGPVTIIQMLLEAGAEINATDHRGRTALSYAIERSQAPVIRALLDANANANIVDKDLRAPLHHAVICRPSSITQLLVEAGADVNLRDSEGNTPLELAEQKRNRYGPRNAKLLGSLLSAE